MRFVTSTGIDYLATSFGNTPGRLEGEAEVDLDLLHIIAAAAPVPLVLHGGTSIPDAAVRQAIRLGAAKINIDTAIRKAVTGVLRLATAVRTFPATRARPFARRGKPLPPPSSRRCACLVRANVYERVVLMLVVMAGLPGTGKSVLARQLAKELDADVLDRDEIRDGIFPARFLDYSAEQNELASQVLYGAAEYILERQPQRVLIFDGRPFSRRAQLDVVCDLAVRLQQALRVIYCRPRRYRAAPAGGRLAQFAQRGRRPQHGEIPRYSFHI